MPDLDRKRSVESSGKYNAIRHTKVSEIITELFLSNVSRSTEQKVFLALKKEGKHSTMSRVFLYTSFVLYCFLRALQQNAVDGSLFVKYTTDELLKCFSCLKR